MALEDHPPRAKLAPMDSSSRVAVVMPYHNNLYDFLTALARIRSVYVVTPRSFRKKTHLAPPVPTQKMYATPRLGPITHAYNPFKLWRIITPDTTHVLVKHLDQIENIVPALIAQARGAKLTVMVQQVHRSHLRWVLIRISMWYLRRVGGMVFSVTSSGRDALKDLLPSVTYIPACIDPKRFPLASLHYENPGALRILAIGKYIQRKNFASLVRAVLLIRTRYPKLSITLTLIGPAGEQSVYDDIARLVSSSPLLRTAVTLHTDIPPEEIPAIIAAHNLFVLPAASEPLGYSVLEAMAAGLPVITTNEVGSASYIENGKNGFIIPDAGEETLTAAITSFVNPDQTVNAEKLRQFGQHSRSLVERFHTPDATIESIQKILT